MHVAYMVLQQTSRKYGASGKGMRIRSESDEFDDFPNLYRSLRDPIY